MQNQSQYISKLSSILMAFCTLNKVVYTKKKKKLKGGFIFQSNLRSCVKLLQSP